MKANEAPERIWIDPTSDLSKLSGHVDKDSVEYIRKDAFLDTLDMKEVDLNKYINKYFKGWYVDLTDQGNILHTPDGNAGLMSVKEAAKHFFELGMSVSNKVQKGEEV